MRKCVLFFSHSVSFGSSGDENLFVTISAWEDNENHRTEGFRRENTLKQFKEMRIFIDFPEECFQAFSRALTINNSTE